ncbi:PREDICTED: uncharacterized protein LOC105960698 [Erythranthe guttata]|uniref:uncharacterized protein LOC105960698 n=1 Tax=Erythranthe guttata TaxID=4155 RepID=UPI00064D78A0|nr:PREDICTED: uncharacterized protein LOC105960698 [Erythranthe guttata]|eukprot:XP_012840356.1 PREDICTED: uncharacterized protein LOC105960698 [Erythranthe guttata]
MLIAWFFNTIEPTLRSTITYRETAQELWEDLQLRFAVANGPKINHLKTELGNCKQRGHSVAEYFGKMKMLWDEINDYEPIFTCNCGGCKCQITQQLRARRDDEQVHQFFMGLEDSMFGTVRSTILNLDPLPNLNRVYAMIMTEEQHRTVARNKDDRIDVVAYLAQSKVQGGPNVTRDKSELCNHCGRAGHDETRCFQVVGYPDWWGDRPKGLGRGGSKGSVRGGGCGRGIARAHAAQTTLGKGSTSSLTDADKGDLSILTSEQWATLRNLLNDQKLTFTDKQTGKICDQWIIDSGASHHMTGCDDLLTKSHDVHNYPVGLPNGAEIVATKEGTTVLGEQIKLNNVLFVPNLNCNLLSVGQFLNETNSVITLTKKMCVIQDCTMRTVIGVGDYRDGIYVLRGVTKVRAHKIGCKDNEELWHKRLGHPSFRLVGSSPILLLTPIVEYLSIVKFVFVPNKQEMFFL